MTDPATLTADQMLAIPATEPERLFDTPSDGVGSLWRELARRWHPDLNPARPQAGAVFAHLAGLHRAAQSRLTRGLWYRPGLLELRAADGRRFRLRARKRREFELGEVYLAPTAIAWVVTLENRDLFDNAIKRITAFRFANDRMRQEIGRVLPTQLTRFETPEALVVVMAKRPDQVLLADLVEFMGGRLDPKHVAWVISSLSNLACYFGYAGLVHGALAADTVLVSPDHHDAAPLGGWWYAAGVGEALVALPQRSAALAPSDVVRAKRADPRLDLDLIRALGRELLGDPSGALLEREGRAPKPVADWLRLASAGDPVADYQAWQEAMRAAWGPRRFTRLPFTAADIYPER